MDRPDCLYHRPVYRRTSALPAVSARHVVRGLFPQSEADYIYRHTEDIGSRGIARGHHPLRTHSRHRNYGRLGRTAVHQLTRLSLQHRTRCLYHPDDRRTCHCLL